MMYRYYRYTLDTDFLRNTAYPFMAGAMRVYEGMLERDGNAYSLPISVSPEYHAVGSRSPWGRNANFQLACIHSLADDLIKASAVLGVTPEPQWAEIREKLPKACLISNDGGTHIAIWEGVELQESHRHHAHLAGIMPFDIFDISDPSWHSILQDSLQRWILRGPCLWSGWCVPWVSMVHSHCGRGEAAEFMLEVWERVFTNEGHGTLHDAHVPGLTLFYGGGYFGEPDPKKEIMQMDAGMAAAAAVQEMLLHTRQGVNFIFAGVPARWREVSFTGMRTDGAFLVSATRKSGTVTDLTVESPHGGIFLLANPWGEEPLGVTANGETMTYSGDVLAIPTAAGETYTLAKA